jgi:hypothetical protein
MPQRASSEQEMHTFPERASGLLQAARKGGPRDFHSNPANVARFRYRLSVVTVRGRVHLLNIS